MWSQQVHSWFVNFIGEEEVLRSTRIDIEVMGKLVAPDGTILVPGVDALVPSLTEKER